MARANANQTNRVRARRRPSSGQSRSEPSGSLATRSDTWLDSTVVVALLREPALGVSTRRRTRSRAAPAPERRRRSRRPGCRS
jgi:hypothetical protein